MLQEKMEKMVQMVMDLLFLEHIQILKFIVFQQLRFHIFKLFIIMALHGYIQEVSRHQAIRHQQQ
jgi:hypothetical protein